MTYNEALRDLAKCAENLAAWRENTAESGFTKDMAIAHWGGRLSAAIANLDSAWEQENAAEPIAVEASRDL